MRSDDFDGDEDFIEFLMKHYKAKPSSDGSYTVETNNGIYRISRLQPNTASSERDSFKQRKGFNKILIPRSRKDASATEDNDVEPNLDNRIRRKHGIKGMFPNPGEILGHADSDSSSETNPLIRIDPPFPSKSNHKRFPEPDPDHYNPSKGFDI